MADNSEFMRELESTAIMDELEGKLSDDPVTMPKSIQKLLVQERRKRDIRNGVVKPTLQERREGFHFA